MRPNLLPAEVDLLKNLARAEVKLRLKTSGVAEEEPRGVSPP
jgi:hypothetical protein